MTPPPHAPRAVFGPLAAGLAGGGLIALAAAGDAAWVNAVHTRAHFPHVDPDAAPHWPAAVAAVVGLAGVVAPLVVGPLAVWWAGARAPTVSD